MIHNSKYSAGIMNFSGDLASRGTVIVELTKIDGFKDQGHTGSMDHCYSNPPATSFCLLRWLHGRLAIR